MKSLLAGLAFSVASAAALAAPITSIDNVRPTPVSPAPGGEVPLSDALTFLFPSGSAQDSTGVFMSATGSATSIPTLILEQTGGAGGQSFGLWFGNDTTSIVRYEIFSGAATGSIDGTPCNSVGCGPDTGSAASIRIIGNTLTVGNAFGDPGITTGVYTDSRINSGFFGFYFQTGDTIAYTLDILNAGGAPRVLAYQGTGAIQSNWAFAYEDGTDMDYNDMVVKVESITRVPLPGTLALLGLGLVGAGMLRRKTA